MSQRTAELVPNRIQLNDFFLDVDDDEIKERDDQEDRRESVNTLFLAVVGCFEGRKVNLANLTDKEFALIERHNMESAVSLVYKMLADNKSSAISYSEEDDDSEGTDEDIKLVLKCMGHVNSFRVPPELCAGFLVLLVKYHFYN